MTSRSENGLARESAPTRRPDRTLVCRGAMLLTAGLAVMLALGGCQSADPGPAIPSEVLSVSTEPIKLLEGDVLRIDFPGAPNLNSQQQIRRDGRITLQLVGEISAAGLTRAELEAEIARLIAPQVVSNQVSVTVVSSSFPIFVTGAVVRPGKVMSDRPLTALEAVMEAGGPDYARANLAAVTIIRHEDGVAKHFTVNLKLVLEGKDTRPFYLKPSDIIYVPERFTWL